jgi:hypothetical protein
MYSGPPPVYGPPGCPPGTFGCDETGWSTSNRIIPYEAEGAAMDRARAAKRDLLVWLMSIGAEQEFQAAVGIGRGNGTQPYSLEVRLDRQTQATAGIPSTWDGLPVHVVVTGPVRAR